MTIQEKTIKLAEAAGWRLFSSFDNLWAPPKHIVEYNCDAYPLPDYFTDLNAVHELENSLTEIQFRTYRGVLSDVVGDVSFFCRKYTSATAAQRCEAIGKTLKLW